MIFGDTKTEERFGGYSLTPFVRDLLVVQLCGGKGPDDFVFTSPAGGVLRSNNFRRPGVRPAASRGWV